MRKTILAGATAGALLVGAAGTSMALPGTAAAADPTASPATTTTDSTPGFSGSEHGPGLDTDDLPAAATALGMTEAELKAELEAGKTAAAIATAKGIDAQVVIDAVVAYDTADIAAAVAAGTMTQARADERLAGLVQHVTDEVNGVASGRGGPGGHGHGISSDDIADVASAVGLTAEELTAKVEAGTSVAAVAEAAGVDVQTAIDAIIAADTAEIADAVAAGTLTQAQADERLANLEQHATDAVNATSIGHRGGGGGHGSRDASSDGTTTPSASPTTGTGTGA